MNEILHVDINSFFASCEQAINCEFKNKPIAVVSNLDDRHRMVLAASYEAKDLGVKTTMSMEKAQKLCKDLIVIQSNHALYEEFSNSFINILNDYSPCIEKMSIDEAFIDLKGMYKLLGSADKISRDIQNRLLKDLGLPCSIGISENKILAKMASNYKKPLGITKIMKKDVEKYLWNMKVSKLYGVGSKTTEILKKMGIYKIRDLALYDIEHLKLYLGDKQAKMIWNYANGNDDSQVVSYFRSCSKSTGKEITFSEDVKDQKFILMKIMELVEQVAYSLRRYNHKAKTITLKVKFNNFNQVTRSYTFDRYINETEIFYYKLKEIYLSKSVLKIPIRLIGVSVSNFNTQSMRQVNLYDIDKSKNNDIDRSIDRIREKYGYDSMKRCMLIKKMKKNNKNIDNGKNK